MADYRSIASSPAARRASLTVDGVSATSRPGALDLYRAVWAAGREWAGRRWVRPSIELGFIVAWLVLRATGDHPTIDAAWTAAAIAVAALSPVSGLVILVITAIRSALGKTPAQSIELAGLYWHFVDLVWVFIFTLFYLV